MFFFNRRTLVGLAGVALCHASHADMLATVDGSLQISRPACNLTPQLFTPTWQHHQARGDLKRDGTGAYRFTLTPSESSTIRGRVQYAQTREGDLDVCYTFMPEQDITLHALFAGITFDVPSWAGGAWHVDRQQGTLPETFRKLGLVSTRTRTLRLARKNAKEALSISFPEETPVMLQDDRRWGPTFSLRIGHSGAARLFPANTPYTIRFTLTVTPAQPLIFDEPITLSEGPEWIPLQPETGIVPGSALDFSCMGFTEAPAGRHGRLVVRKGHFAFERLPGVPQRFYGVNLCFSANFPDPDMAGSLAARFARIGYNAIRLHHHDRGLVEASPDGTTLNPENLARMDALMAACISNGIYVTTDLYVSRRVPWRAIGVDRDGLIAMNTFKMLVPVHEGAFENLKTFARQWLTHVNPHTRRRYADEPALAWLAMTNEGNFSNFITLMHTLPEWRQAWKTWLNARQTANPAFFAGIPDEIPQSIHTPGAHTTAFLLFLKEREDDMMRRLKVFLRDELKCRALITNRSCWTNHASDQIHRNRYYDFVDDHFYVDHPRFIENPWRLPSRCDNRNPIQNSALGAQRVVFTRLFDHPFTITEYNYSGPGRFRGVGGMVTGAMGALQGWSGIWRFAYSHDRKSLHAPQGGPMGYFDMVCDPLSQAAERISLCLFLRRDLAPLKQRFTLLLPEADVLEPRAQMPRNQTEWPWLAWYAQIGTQVGTHPPETTTWSGTFPEIYQRSPEAIRAQTLGNQDKTWPVAGDGAVRIDPSSGTVVITTPRTCGGFTESGRITAGDLMFDVGDTAATLWVSSLDNQPIHASSRLLLTHLTDVQNSGIRYAEQARKTLLAWGGLPHLARKGRARISLRMHADKRYRVYALSTSGRRVATCAVTREKEMLRFIAAVDGVPGSATLLYEIVSVP